MQRDINFITEKYFTYILLLLLADPQHIHFDAFLSYLDRSEEPTENLSSA